MKSLSLLFLALLWAGPLHAQQLTEKQLATWLKRFPAADANKDGKLSKEERKAAREDAAKNRKKRGKRGGQARAKLIKEFDKDGDGKLNKDERAALQKALKERRKKNAGKGKRRDKKDSDKKDDGDKKKEDI